MRHLELAVPGHAGGVAQVLHVAWERLARQRHHRDRYRLADRQVTAVQFRHLRADLPVVEVENLRHRHARANVIAELDGWERHSRCEHHQPEGIRLKIDVARALGFQCHALDVLLGHVRPSSWTCSRRPSGSPDPAAVVVFLLARSCSGLAQAVLGGFERDLVLAGPSSGTNGFLRRSSSASLTCGPGRLHGVACLFILGLVVGFRLNDPLLGFGEIGLGFAQVVLLLSGVELNHHIAGLRPVHPTGGES